MDKEELNKDGQEQKDPVAVPEEEKTNEGSTNNETTAPEEPKAESSQDVGSEEIPEEKPVEVNEKVSEEPKAEAAEEPKAEAAEEPKTEEAAEEPKAEEAAEEPKVEAAEEPKAEETAEEHKAEASAEEPKAEAAEEPKAGVTAEEHKAEAAAEEPKAEAAAEEPKAEAAAEEPKAEEAAEEPKAEEAAEEPKAEEAAEEPKAETKPEAKEETTGEEAKKEEEKEDPRKAAAEARRRKLEELFEELTPLKESEEPIDVKITSRIRGGLRAVYKDVQLFLPASHFTLKRNPLESELKEAVGKDVKVLVHELQEDEQGRKTIIVSRKKILEEAFWTQINIGDVVEGKVSSIAKFGVFVDIGGIEGLIHISRLSQVHIEDPKDFVKKGDKIKAVIIEADRERNRIALSHKELEESPWEEVPEKFPVGSTHTGIVRRLTDFGAYIELKPGVDGLLRTGEMSWTKRIKSPSDILNPGDKVEIEVIAMSEEKKTITLSHKRTTPNPWGELAEKYTIGSEASGKVSQVVQQGVIVTVEDVVDGFMPKSKLKPIMQGKQIPLSVGDNIDVVVADIVPDDESLILAPKIDEDVLKSFEQSKRKPSRKREKLPSEINADGNNAFTLGDILSDLDANKLKDNLED